MDAFEAVLARKRLWQYYDLALGPVKPETMGLYRAMFRGCASRAVKEIAVLGCGTGRWLVALGRREYAMTGVESDKTAVAAARRKCQGAGLRARLIERGIAAWMPDGSYDAVLAPSNALKRLPDHAALRECLARAGRALRPGGIMILELSFEAEDWRSRAWGTEEQRRAQARVSEFSGPGVSGQYRGYCSQPNLKDGRAQFVEEFTCQDCAEKIALQEKTPWLLFSAKEFAGWAQEGGLVENTLFYNETALEPTEVAPSVLGESGGQCLFVCRRRR